MTDHFGFPDSGRFFVPQRFEADLHDCEVTGQIPPQLDGAFIRIGSDWVFPPKFKNDSPFNEDGYVSRFRIKNGKCSYKGRWIRTRRYENNLAAGRQLYGCYRNPYTDDESVRDTAHPQSRTVANTAPFAFGGKLLALKEDGHPYEIDPVTLETRGSFDFNGQYRCPTFTAHPKLDSVTGDLFAYGYEAMGPASNDLWLTVIGADGRIKHEVRFKVPYVSMLHDIALTEKHIIFPVFPYVTSLEWLQAGKVHWAWDNAAPLYYGVFPRDGEAGDMRWFKGPQRAVLHTLSARTQGDKVILDAPIFDGNPFPFFPAVDGSPWNPAKAGASLRRVTFDLSSKSDSYVEEIIFPEPAVADLVRIDERFIGQAVRYGFTAFADESKFDHAKMGDVRRRVFNCYGRFDMQERRYRGYFAGPTHGLQEVCFVPRSADAPEGDGYILGVANNFAEMRAELIIADTQNLEAGDVARVILPFRSNVQVHGNWYTAAELPGLAQETL